MIAYTTYDPVTGKVRGVAVGTDDALAYPEDEPYVPYHPPRDGRRYKVVAGEFVVDDDPVPERPYQDLRRPAYPNTGDQLDALWAMVEALAKNQVAPDAALVVLQQIKVVKAQYPKPEEPAP